MSGRGREALLDEALPDFWEWLRGPPGFTGVVGSPWGFAGVVGKASQMSESGREPLPNVRVWSEVSQGCPGVIGSPSRMSGSGRDSFSDVRTWS